MLQYVTFSSGISLMNATQRLMTVCNKYAGVGHLWPVSEEGVYLVDFDQLTNC